MGLERNWVLFFGYLPCKRPVHSSKNMRCISKGHESSFKHQFSGANLLWVAGCGCLSCFSLVGGCMVCWWSLWGFVPCVLFGGFSLVRSWWLHSSANVPRSFFSGWFFVSSWFLGYTNSWLVVEPTHLKTTRQFGSFPQVGVIKNVWNHHMYSYIVNACYFISAAFNGSSRQAHFFSCFHQTSHPSPFRLILTQLRRSTGL